jgi:hypothetical protein
MKSVSGVSSLKVSGFSDEITEDRKQRTDKALQFAIFPSVFCLLPSVF